jgi:hypothetical protein
MVLGGEEGGWWLAVALVSFYGTDEGRRSLGMRQLRRTTRGGELTEEGRAAVLRRDSGVEKGPPWSATVSEVTGGRKSSGGGVLRRGILR